MAVEMKISGKQREIVGSRTAVLRRAGFIPAVLYGHKIKENVLLSVDKRDFERTFKRAGESTLIELNLEKGTPRTVLVHDVQYDILSGAIIHVDFYEVDMTEKITTHVQLEFIGESNAIKELGGTLTKNMNEVEVESLPGDLPHSIIVDIGKLNTFEDVITLADLDIDREKVKIEGALDLTVAKVLPPRSDEELAALEQQPVTEEVSAVEGVKKEGDEEASAEDGKEKAEEPKEEKKEEKKEKE